MKRKFCAILLCLLTSVCVCLVACTQHEHEFSDKWTSDEKYHWHTAVCEHTDELKDKAEHTFEGNKCKVCNYETKHEHTYDSKLSAVDDTYHWYAPTCGDTTEGKDKAEHTFEGNKCKDCNYEKKHEHTYASQLSIVDDTYHWYAPTCGDTTEGKDKQKHTIGSDGKCACGFHTKHIYDKKRTPVQGEEEEYHWYAPTCGDITEGLHKEMHVFSSKNTCFKCEYVLTTENPEVEGRYYYYDPESEIPYSETFFFDLKAKGEARIYNYTQQEQPDGSWKDVIQDYNGTYTLDDSDNITVTVPGMDNGTVSGKLGDGIKLGKGVLALNWGDDWGEIYFCKYYRTPELVIDGFVARYDETKEGYTVLGITDEYEDGEILAIPDALNGIPVFTVGNNSFEGTYFSEVIIGDNIETIGVGAFASCPSISKISFGKNIKNIGAEDGAYDLCSALEELVVSSENETFCGVDNCIIEKSTGTVVLACETSILPTDGTIKSIGNNAFKDRSGLKSIEIPEGVIDIQVQAFFGCRNMKTITLPRSLEKIDTWAFGNCVFLEKIIFRGTLAEWTAIKAKGDSIGFGWFTGDSEPEVECLVTDEEPQTYTVNIAPSEYGSVNLYSEAESFSIGDELMIMITPDSGYALESFSVNGESRIDEVKNGVLYYLTVTGNMTITATFKQTGSTGGDQCEITLSYDEAIIAAEVVSSENGEITIGIYFENYDYEITAVKVDGTEVEFYLEEDRDYDYYLTVTVTGDATIEIVCEITATE